MYIDYINIIQSKKADVTNGIQMKQCIVVQIR